MDSNPIHHPSPAQKVKCSFLDYVQLLIIGQAGRWTSPSANPLQPIKWNAHFCITINFWFRPGWSMDSNPICHPSPANKMKCYIFGLRSTSDDWLGWLMDSNPIFHPSSVKKWNGTFWIMFNFWWLAGLVMNSNPILPPLSSQKMKCSFLDYVQLLMISLACRWTWTPSTPVSSQKMKCSYFGLCSTSDDCPGWLMDSNPIHHPSLPKKMKCLIFSITFTSDDLPGWLMNLNPICHPSPANKMKCFFLDCVHFWWSARLVDGLEPHPPPISTQKNEILIFGLH